jgi:hypothetical protein
VRLSWLARNGRTGVPARLERGVASPGEESLTAAVAARRSRRSRPSARSSHKRGHVVRAPDSIPGEDVADIKRPAQEARFIERRKRNPGVQKGGHACSGPRTGTRVADTGLLAKIIAALKLKRCEGVSLTVGICDSAPAGYPT